MEYSLLKRMHMACAGISYALFFWRGLLMFAESPLLRTRALRSVPHLNDTLLLVSAIWMVVISGQYPLAQDWLTAKLVALVAYVGVGMVAFSYGRGRRVRLASWAMAQLIFGYIVLVALTRSPVPIPRG